ncbi:MAG: homocysteine S-methyltransferase family protein [Candidatus Fermentibacteraceae bacterium]|nr:homocysteine S-methyltransferase family protein [Candidatus Fermentibacteraceae bacterium]MBN2607485.1 homocysteine S-methyltransferase family protein [Candidatus Fermentibacteraceae bacterium]
MELLKGRAFILADGAIGEYLFSLGYPGSYLASEAVIRSPEILASVHRDYAEAGAAILTTNTFDANVAKLDGRGLAERCEEINYRAVGLAGRNRKCSIMGSIGPPASGRSFSTEPFDGGRLREIFGPQIAGLLAGGVDMILLETQMDPPQARALFDTVREFSSDIPVAVSFTYGQDLLTPSGFSIADSIEAFVNTDIVMLGANHGTGPLQFMDIHRRLSSESPFPVMLQPNSGIGKYSDGRFVFPRNPDHFCRCMLSCADGSTALLGGCCGTTPEFISMLSRRMTAEPVVRVFSSPSLEEPEEQEVRTVTGDPPVLSSQLAARDALIIELLPPRGGDLSAFASRADRLRKYAPVTISIPDSPMGKVRMSPCISGLYLRDRLGVEPLVHFALRDRSLTRIQSDLLALSGSGLQAIFLISGDPPSLGDYPESTAVYDLTTEQTLLLLRNLSMGVDLNGRKIGSGAGFFPGSAVSLGDPCARDKLERRWEAGCRFFISQPVFSMKTLEEAGDLLEEFPVLPALMPFRNRYSAEYLAAEVPGISIPAELLDRIRELDDGDVPGYSLDHLSRLMDQMRKMVSGVYLAGSRKGTADLAEAWRRN